MAAIYYSINLGSEELASDAVTVGTSAPSTHDVLVTIDKTNAQASGAAATTFTREAVLRALLAIKLRIEDLQYTEFPSL